MLKLVIYKKNAYVYLVGGTKEAIIKLDKNAEIFEILNELNYKITPYFGILMKDSIIKENFTKLKQHYVQLAYLKN